MNNIAKVTGPRAGERRVGDRRKADLPMAGKDRRADERRSGSDRRA